MSTQALSRDQMRGILAAYSCVFVMTVGLGLTLPLLPILMERMGASATLIGLNTAIGGLALFVTAPLVPWAMRAMGGRKFLNVCFVISALSLAAFPLIPDIAIWFVLRFVLNAGLQGLFVGSEIWINQLAPESHRGRIIGFYGAIATAGFAIGPLLLGLLGTEGPAPFMAAAALMIAGFIPVLAGRTLRAPESHDGTRGVWLALLAVPLLHLAGLIHAAAELGISSFLPLFAIDQGLSEERAIILLTAFGFGNVLLQIPIGWLADRMNRQLVLASACLIAAMCVAALPLAETFAAMLAIAVIAGGTIVGIYTLGLTMIGARFPGAAAASANAAFALAYAGGSILGPMGTGLAMDSFGNNGLPVVICSLTGAYGLVLLMTIRSARRA
ncbi:MAG TPA: MFS transporter [Micropepsaceae bacterium]|nr:MFS transporter [Micropepsaceae bacterium]